jgi:hypothetical protein
MVSLTLAASGRAGAWRRAGASACCIALLSPALAVARAQVIAVKTAPIAEGGQFGFLPSANLGMGGLSIALADSALDPFVNPAKGARLRGTRVFGAPTFFSVSRNAGGGVTLPVGASVSAGAWFTQFAVAMQDVERGGPDEGLLFPEAVDVVGGAVPADDEPSRQNRYVHATVGRRFSEGRLSVAASASWWGLHAVDGVELYYPTALSVRQRGDAVDLRVGLLREWRGGQSFEATALHNRFDVRHDVSFSELFWDPSLRQLVTIPRREPNADRTETWGVHLAYARPLADSTWRVGGILTANRIRQPSLPAYDLPQVPADAGRAHAYDVGAGIARSTARWTVGVDAIFEPIWSRTWVRADAPTETRTGATIDAGTNTLESRFRFANGVLRTGVGRTLPLGDDRALTLEAGGQLRAIRYRLEQRDAVQQSNTASSQRWNEWTRSWGLGVRFAGADVRYRGRLTTGAGRPGFDDGGGIVVDFAAPRPGGDIVGFGPFNPTTFGDVRVTTHQISLSVPIR